MSKKIKKILFTLSTFKRNPWGENWTCEKVKYYIVRKILAEDADKILSKKTYEYGYHVTVVARKFSPKKDKKAMRNGFCEYEWMIDSICQHGEIKA